MKQLCMLRQKFIKKFTNLLSEFIFYIMNSFEKLGGGGGGGGENRK